MPYTILYPTPLKKISDPTDDNIDVCVSFEDGERMTLVVSTPKHMQRMLMESGVPYWDGAPMVLVAALTEENIEALVASLAQDRPLMRLYGCNAEDLMPVCDKEV